jgi:uncharacterized protein (TIGR00661 family)
MKVLFGVQSEGNGHMTQALCVQEYLKTRNYEIGPAFVAKKKKGLAKYFTDSFETYEYEGFDFVFGKDGKVIIWQTFLKGCIEMPKLIYSFIKICAKIKKEKPDVIVNFYEPLVGLTALFFRDIKYISFGHQYAMEADNYPLTTGFYFQKLFLGIINVVSSINAKIVALSYYKFEDPEMIICPPVLRKESYTKSKKQEDFVLIYLMNEDMVSQLVDNAALHPDINIECFTKLTRKHQTISNVKLYNLDGQLFQEKMKVCSAVVCSGGFETSSEAILHNKPLLMIPLPNHFEQYANCNDAQIHGFAKFNNRIDLSLIPESQKNNDEWFYSYKEVLDEVFSNL